MAGISFAGIGSGLPVDDIITQEMDAKKIKVENLKIDKQNLELKKTVVTNIDTLVANMLAKANAIKTASGFVANTASVSSESVASIAVDSTADIGNYSIEVAAGTFHVLKSAQGLDNTDESFISDTAGTFSFDDGTGKQISVNYSANTTLDEFKNLIQTAIEDQNSTAEVSIITTGANGGSYNIQLKSAEEGANKNIKILTDDTNLIFNGTTISEMEEIDLKGSANSALNITGDYANYANKKLTVISGGTIGTDDIEIKIEDTENETSQTITITGTGTYDLGDGVSLNVVEDGKTLDTDKSYTLPSLKNTDEDVLSLTGEYNGYVSKRIKISVAEGGFVGTDEIKLNWLDPVEGTSGTINFTEADEYEIAQGVKINIAADGKYLKTASEYAFELNANTIQQGQDDGIARNEKEVHYGHADTDLTPVTNTDATFSYSYGGSDIRTLNVKAGTTLTELKNLINVDPNNPGVTASIINDGSGQANSYHLAIVGNESGSGKKIEDISFTLDNFESQNGFTETQKASNSMFKVNGYPTGEGWLQRTSNLVTDAIEGASVTLKNTGETSISVENDHETMITKVEEFVTAYNELQEYLNKITEITINKTKVSTDSSSDTAEEDNLAALFAGDYSVRMMQSKLTSIITSRAKGFGTDDEGLSLFAQAGIEFEDDNKLKFDKSVIEEALNDDPDALINLFTADRAGSSDNSNIQFSSSLSVTNPGKYLVEVEFDDNGNVTTSRYRSETSQTWHDLAVGDNGSLTATSGDARGMALGVVWDGSSSNYSSTVSIKQGKGNEFYEEIEEFFDSEEGITKVISESIDNNIEDLNDRIERENRRNADYEARLKAKYNKLEVAMSEMNNQLTQLTNQLGQLGGSTE